MLTGIIIYIIKNKKTFTEIPIEPQIVSDSEEYLLIDKVIQKYYTYLSIEEYEKAFDILDKEYIEKYEITKEKIKEEREKQYLNYISQKIYSYKIDKYSKIYFVKGMLYKVVKEKSIENENNLLKKRTYELDELEKREYKDTYYIVKIDYINKTFSISKDIQKYDNVFNNM